MVGDSSLFTQLQDGHWIAWVTGERLQVILMLRAYGIAARHVAPPPSSSVSTVCVEGMRGEGLVPIRPDSYIGLVCRPIREDIVADYLANLGAAPALAREAPAPVTALGA